MTDVDASEPLSNISDSSFIILGQGSLPPSINNETTDGKSLNKNQNAFVFFESDKSPGNKNTLIRLSDGENLEDDIQEKLNQLVRENCQLKETLSQNNLAIKSQLDTFYMWQQEVLKTHETHKQKFLETRDFILKLRAENLSLRKQLDEAFCTLGDDDSLVQMNKKCDGDNLKEGTEKFKNMYEDLAKKNENLEMENMGLKEKLKATEKEVLKLNSELEDVMRENKFLKQKNDELHENSVKSVSHVSLPNSEARAQIINLFKQLEMERNKSSKLKEKLRKTNEIMSKAQILNASQEVDEYLRNLDDLNLSFDSQNERFSTLQSWVTLTEENIKEGNCDSPNENLGEVKELKCHISQEEKTSREKEENLQELKDRYNRLLEDYKDLQRQLTLIENKESDSERYKNEVYSLSEELKRKEEELLSKQKEYDQLKEEITKLSSELEEINVLKFQVQLYKNDFNDERAARERLAGEKENMAEQVRHLQSRIEELEKGQPEEQPKEERPYEGTKSSYLCPKCMFSFSDLKRCEEHVDECLNIHFYP